MFLSAMRVGKFSLSALRPKTSLSQRSLKASNKIVVSLLEGTHTHTLQCIGLHCGLAQNLAFEPDFGLNIIHGGIEQSSESLKSGARIPF